MGQSLVYCCKCLFVVVIFLASTQVLISVVMIPDIAFLLSQLNPCWHMSWAKLFVIFWWHADLVNYVAAVNSSCFLQWGVDVDSLLSHCLIGEFLKGFGPSLCLWPVLSISDTVAVYRQTTWSGCSLIVHTELTVLSSWWVEIFRLQPVFGIQICFRKR